ncbi:hypothetical protein Ahy_A02g007344 isoform B [Arachis hypogaea]|uniref:Myb/SANT-like domain-containing protein n=1 Tax=Arachis hypogaea TaxID=3818 RepID=A0A445ECA8_ARAHY|nr:hypothetical protein Ahy_A02g007344 isoform B [Arachis hypogaea]
MDITFIDALIEECYKRNRMDDTFTTMAYDNILLLLRSIYGNHLCIENLKNRLKTLKNHFGVCYYHFHRLSRFFWNPIIKMFEAKVEVWEELIKVNFMHLFSFLVKNFTSKYSRIISIIYIYI